MDYYWPCVSYRDYLAYLFLLVHLFGVMYLPHMCVHSDTELEPQRDPCKYLEPCISAVPSYLAFCSKNPRCLGLLNFYLLSFTSSLNIIQTSLFLMSPPGCSRPRIGTAVGLISIVFLLSGINVLCFFLANV